MVELLRAVLENVREQIRQGGGAIRHPVTGEFPTVIVKGDDIENLNIMVEGSPELVALVRQRLGANAEEVNVESTVDMTSPKVFLSYTSDDRNLAESIAKALQAKGIDVWWDQWCIYSGESLRQKIDGGITNCTHFLVLLTPRSINKPWVNQEMDAGLVSKLKGQCKFLPVRHELPVTALPPLLSGMFAPEITTGEHLEQLINDIHGISRKPPLGAPPDAVTVAAKISTGYSPAATAIARYFVEQGKDGLLYETQVTFDELANATGLSAEDMKDALYELSHYVNFSQHINSQDRVMVRETLYAEFDRYWMDWNTADDALRLATDLVHDENFPSNPQEIVERYGWTPRRLNPVIHYLLERKLIVNHSPSGTPPFPIVWISKNENTRRFVKSRS